MVIDQFYVISKRFVPLKNEAELIVDTNTIKTTKITLERFQSISWRNSEVIEPNCSVQHIQFSQDPVKHRARNPLRSACVGSVKKVFGQGITKSSDQWNLHDQYTIYMLAVQVCIRINKVLQFTNWAKYMIDKTRA